jgi:L-rhamnose isomerase
MIMTSAPNTYDLAREAYVAQGVDTEAALRTLAATPVSLHCWQGDDVTGFEVGAGNAGSGCMATGNYPGRARNFAELTSDIEAAAGCIPGPLKLNLHASYATEKPAAVDRDGLEVQHFASWIDWAKQHGWGLDFNPTCFGHRHASEGFTLSHRDAGIRQFWIDHCVASRKIGAGFGQALGRTCVTNLWIPDGYKDTPADRWSPRQRLQESLEAVYADRLNPQHHLDAVESKLFGLGVESYTVGSHEFYLGFAVRQGIGYCLDAGHFHPTESVADKISSLLLHVPHVLLHVSRGVRWDSDHVVILDDPTVATLSEVARGEALDRVFIGMDYFDASINRVAAWVIGTRSTKKALLLGLLQPYEKISEAEESGDHTARLALQEDARTLPWATVWAEFCRRENVPADNEWLPRVRAYEAECLAPQRG